MIGVAFSIFFCRRTAAEMAVNMSKKIKIGIAGAGFIAVAHYDCAKTVYGVK